MNRLIGHIQTDDQTIPISIDITFSNRTELTAALVQLLPRQIEAIMHGQINGDNPWGDSFTRRTIGPTMPTQIYDYDQLTIDHLTGDESIDWGIIALRFPSLKYFISNSDIAAAKRYLFGDNAIDSQFENNLATLLLMPRKALIKASGKINKSAIAEAIGKSAGGSSNWPYISKLAAALDDAWAEQDANEPNQRAA